MATGESRVANELGSIAPAAADVEAATRFDEPDYMKKKRGRLVTSPFLSISTIQGLLDAGDDTRGRHTIIALLR